MRRSLSFAAAALLAVSAVQAQDSLRSGRRTPLPREREIALARSAAPAAVSDSATIWVLGDTAYVVAVRGTNGNACFVSRDWIDTLEPHCFDEEGAGTVMRMAMLHVEQLHRGRTEAEAQQAIAQALHGGSLRPPRRPAMSYMMSAAQWLIDDNRSVGGHWHPHLMIYYPYLTAGQLGLGRGSMSTAMVFGANTPWTSIVIILRDFVQPAPAARAGP